MIRVAEERVYLENGTLVTGEQASPHARALAPGEGTIAGEILAAHDRSDTPGLLRLRFDSLTSHDITYVGIIQTARASGLTRFPMPYVLTNCHNSLCAVGGTINEDDHLFGLSAARKYGGVFVPAHQAVIHQYNRECMTGCGKMILGSDSHTRYGALGTMGVGEGGPELVKQLLENTYDLARPPIIAVYLSGAPAEGVGPQDVALSLIGRLFPGGLVKNKVLEFIGPGVASLSVDFRNGIDVMTTETACLSSVWTTDEAVREYYALHGREEDYRPLAPAPTACYDGAVWLDLSRVRPMIALPFHPSNAYSIAEFQQNAGDILRETEKTCLQSLGVPIRLTDKLEGGRLRVDQAVIAGCSGGSFENLMAADAILSGGSAVSGGFGLSLYPASTPIFWRLMENGAAARLTAAGAVLRTAFCGPCFGAGDVPANGGLSIRHTTRNFPNREGAKPAQGQIAAVALMDARSIAATARNGGLLTSAEETGVPAYDKSYTFNPSIYRRCVTDVRGRAEPETPLRFGPNIADWPPMPPMPEHLLLSLASVISDPVTTTDELIPSGETSSYRSNPEKLSEFTLSRKDPAYVGRAKEIRSFEASRRETGRLPEALQADAEALGVPEGTALASAVYACRPGDGSAREQAASCQRVLGGGANIALEYATKRYRSNLINWGMLPLLVREEAAFAPGDLLLLEGVRSAIASEAETLSAKLLRREDGQVLPLTLRLGALTKDEREILLAGGLIGYYREKMNKAR